MYGDLPREYGLEWKGSHLGNLNAPHFQLLMTPLVPLGYRGALAVWLAANVVLTIVGAWLVIRELRPTLTPKRVLLTSLLVFASVAWTSVAVTGEMSLLLLVPFTAAWIAARRERWATAGVLLGICVSFKVFFLVFAAWLTVARCWRAVAGMIIGAALCVGAGMLAFGPAVYVQWVNGFSRVAWWWLPMNVSLRGVAERVFHAGPPLATVIDAPWAARPVWLAMAAIVAALTSWSTWPSRGRGEKPDPDRLFPVLLLAALLMSPLGWVYYLSLLTAPLVALVVRRELAGPGRPSLICACVGLGLLYLPMELTESGQPSALATLLLASSHTWGTILLWAVLVWRARAPAREPLAV